MVDPRPSSRSNEPDSHGASRVDDLVAEYLDRLNSGQSLDPLVILSEHPDLGPEVIEKLEAFVGLTPALSEDRPLGTIGDYTLRRQIGRGGMGVVYEAWENSMNRPVALKVLPAGIAADTRTLTRFVREAQIAGGIHHPSVVPVYGMGVKEKTPYYAMELVEGETLAQILSKMKTSGQDEKTPFGFPRDDVAYYSTVACCFADVSDGLQHAHAQGVIHRDIKPSNLILDREGRLRILDFGLARVEGQESLTLSGDCIGTPQYMSPEQARRKKIPIDYRTDIYSLGATLYEMLTLEPPFRGKDHADTLSQIIERDPVEPRRRNPGVPRDLETIVLKCLRKEPTARFGTAEALAQDLRRFARGDPIEARPQAVLARLLRKASRHRWRLTVAALLAILLATTGLLLERSQREAEARRTADYESAVRSAVIKLQVRQPTLQVTAAHTPFLIDRRDFQMVGGGGSGDPVEQAAAELEATARSLPRRPDAHFQRGRALLLLGRNEEAKAALEQAIRADPGFAPASVLLSSILDGTGDHDGARRVMVAIESTGQAGWAKAWISAQRATDEGRWEEALAAYGKLLEMERSTREPYLGSSIDLRLARGIARLEEKDFLGAIEDFVAARLLSPRSPEPGLLLGKAYFEKGEEDQAERTFVEVLEQARREPSARNADKVCLGVTAIYGYHHRWERGLGWVSKVSEEGIRERIRARILYWLGRRVESLEAARKAVRLNPRDGRAYAVLAALFLQDTPVEAERIVQEGIAVDPQDFRLHKLQAGILESRGKLDAAMEEDRKAIELGGDFSGLGELLLKKGEIQKAFEMLRKGIEVAPGNTFTHDALGDAYLTQHNFQEALAEYRRSLEIDPGHGVSSVLGLRSILALKEKTDLGPELEHLIDLLEKLFWEKRRLHPDLLDLFQAGISALLARPGGDHLEQALRRCRRAAEATGRKQPALLAALAEAQFANGLHTESVLTLEEALSFPHAGPSLEEALERYREAVFPDLASYASIDAAIAASAGAGPERRQRLLESFRTAARGETAASRVAYFEARLLEDAGRHSEAAEKLKPLISRGDGRPEPRFHLAECLRRAGDARGAESELREVLEKPVFSDADDLWRLWAAICFVDLHRKPAEMLAKLPAQLPGYGADLRWLLEQLASGRVIRINCGGEEYRDPKGEVWGRDRFFSSGYANFESDGRLDHYSSDIQGTEKDILYQTARWFPTGERRRAGYVIPLPQAAYRITLHFAETFFTEPKQRSFDVLIEGEEVLKDYEPLSKGFAAADPHDFKTEVKDGVLDIEFVHRVEDPMVSAIEIEAIQ